MEIQELYDILVGTLFPKDITDHFTIVHVEPLPDVLVVHFEEKDDYHDKEAGHPDKGQEGDPGGQAPPVDRQDDRKERR